jgi:Tfp pilus assembly protein PilF
MFSSSKEKLGIIIIIVMIAFVIFAYCSSSQSELLATGLLDPHLKEQLNERPYLTPQEYEEILKKVEEALRSDPNNLSANILKIELETKPILR